MLRSLLILGALALLLAGSCNSTKTTTAPASTSTSMSTPTATAPRGERPGGRGEAGQRLTETITRLGLDEAQATKFKEITQRYAQQGRELRENAGDDRQAARTAGQEMRQKMDEEINALLNKDQQEIYTTIKAEQQEARRNERGGGRPGGRRPGGGR